MSLPQDVVKNIEWYRSNTATSIDLLQAGLIPAFLDLRWARTDIYFYNSSYVVSRDPYESVIQIEGLRNNLYLNIMNNIYKDTMVNAYNNEMVQAFLVFVNKKLIPWSKITIVRNYSSFYLIIAGLEKSTIITDFDIMYIPYKVLYTEAGPDTSSITKTLLFQFDMNGRFSYSPTIYIYALTTNINIKLYDATTTAENRFYDYDMGIPVDRKITSRNFLVFDANKELYKSCPIEVKNTNLMYLDNGTRNRGLICYVFYNSLSNKNEANTIVPVNSAYVKKLITRDNPIVMSGMDVTKLSNDFDFSHNKNLDYSTNIQNSLNYIYAHNEDKMDSTFTNRNDIEIIQYTPSIVASRAVSGVITMMRDKYKGNGETFPIIYQNGYLPAYYNSIVYGLSKFSFKPTPGLTYSDTLEIAYYKGINNTILKIDMSVNGNSRIVGDRPIPKKDMILFTGNATTLYPLDFNIDANNKIVLADATKYSTPVYIASKRQFLYERYNISSSSNRVQLSSKFNTGYDPTKYMVFINGRLANVSTYRILIPDITSNNLTAHYIYSMKTFNAGDRVEVFYTNTPNMNYMNFAGDLLVSAIKTKAYSDKQRRFKVPYPFPSYPRSYDSFYVIKNSLYLSKENYVLDGDYIVIQNSEDFTPFAHNMIFVFPYYRPDSDDDGEIENSDFVQMTSRYVTASSDQSSFILPIVTNKDKFNLFVNTTYIDPTRYTVSGNTLTFTNEVIKSGKTLCFLYDKGETGNYDNTISVQVAEVVATTNGQYIFTIPYPKYYDSFMVFKGSVLIDPDRYFIIEGDKIFLLNSYDYLNAGKKLLFVFTTDLRDGTVGIENSHIKTEYLSVRPTVNTQSIDIPVLYGNIKYTSDNTMVFLNTTYIKPDRYTITNNRVTLTDSNDIFRANKSIIIVYMHRVNSEITYDSDLDFSNQYVKFESKYVYATSDGQTAFTIPYPTQFQDTQFFLTIGNTFVSDDTYNVYKGTLTMLTPKFNIAAGRELTFTFVHNGGFTYINKKSVGVVATSDNQLTFNIPSPYNKLNNLNRRMIITYGNTYIDKDCYVINNNTKTITLINYPIARGRQLYFTFYYTFSPYNGAITYLPESGYVSFNRYKLNHNTNKDMYMMFINGRKVCKSQLLDISDTLIKVQTDIGRRFNLSILDYAPIIPEISDQFQTRSEWVQILDNISAENVNILENSTNIVTDNEVAVAQNKDELEIMALVKSDTGITLTDD